MYLAKSSQTEATSKYGAIWFSHFQSSVTNGVMYNDTVINQCLFASTLGNYSSDCARFGGVGYTVQYNFTALHAALLYENVANEVLVRHATSNPNFTVETTIAPLPVTANESNLAVGDISFLVWFLVSCLNI